MGKRDDLFDVDLPEEGSPGEGQEGEDFFFEMNDEDSADVDPQQNSDAVHGIASDEELPVQAKSNSRQKILLLLLLVVLLLGAAYFYLGDMLLVPDPAPEIKVVQSPPQKQKIPERNPIVREQPDVEEVVIPNENVSGTPVEAQSEAVAENVAEEQEPVAETAAVESAKQEQSQPPEPSAADAKGDTAETPATASGQPETNIAEKAETTPADAKAPYVLQIGAYVLDSNLLRTKEKIKSLGYEPIVLDGKKMVTMTRLRVGAYPGKVAREKLTELQPLAPSAFLLPEGDHMVLYAGSYYGLDRARLDADLLYQHEIHLDEETAEVAVPIKTVRFGAFSDAEAAEVIAEQAQKLGLDTLVVKQN